MKEIIFIETIYKELTDLGLDRMDSHNYVLGLKYESKKTMNKLHRALTKKLGMTKGKEAYAHFVEYANKEKYAIESRIGHYMNEHIYSLSKQ